MLSYLELQLARLEGETVRKSIVEEAPAVEELAEAAAVRKAEEDWSMEGEKDGPLEEWTRKELKEECRTFGLSDRCNKAKLIERITKARAATVRASQTEEAVAPVEEIVVIKETEAFVEEALAVEELAEATALGPKGDNAMFQLLENGEHLAFVSDNILVMNVVSMLKIAVK